VPDVLCGARERSFSERARSRSLIFRLNFTLVAVFIATLLAYVFLSNFLVSQKYILNVSRQKLNQASAALSNETSAEIYNMKDLLLFAQTSGLVEAKEIGVILEESGIALSETTAVSRNR
jgi:TctA family transporter